MKNEELTIIENQLPEIKEAIEKSGITKQEADGFLLNFIPNIKALSEFIPEVIKIETLNPTAEDCTIAKELRMKILKNRTASQTIKETLKAEFLQKGAFIQSVFNIIEGVSKKNEEKLAQIEKHIELKEAKAKAELKAKREEELGQYMDNVSLFPLGEIAEEAYQDLLKSQKALKREKEQEQIIIDLQIQRLNEMNPYSHLFSEETRINFINDNFLGRLTIADWANLFKDAKEAKEAKDNELKLEQERQKIINGRINTLSSMGFIFNQEKKEYCYTGKNLDGSFACELYVNDFELNSTEEAFHKLLGAHANIIGKIMEAKQEEQRKRNELVSARVKELEKFNYVPANLESIASLDANEWTAYRDSHKQAFEDRKEKEVLQKQLDDQKKELKASRLKRLEKYGFVLSANEIESMLKMSNEGFDNYVNTLEKGWQKQQDDLKAEQEASKNDKSKMIALTEDLNELTTKYVFKSKKHNKTYEAANIKINELILLINKTLN